MELIKASGSNLAWRTTLKTLLAREQTTGNEKYYRDSLTIIEIPSPQEEEPDPLFPMPAEELKVINRFITTGEDEESVTHEWTKLYYHRIFDAPFSQMEYLLERLALPEPEGDTQISLWDKRVDQNQVVSPCTLVIWARRRESSVELHVHAHSSDAYKKLLMNLQEFVALHHYIAKRAGLLVGPYYHIIDSCHIHSEDREAAESLVSRFD